MTFKEGEPTGHICPKCSEELIFEMSFYDTFDPVKGHNTVDRPLIACQNENCLWCEDYEPEEDDDGEDARIEDAMEKLKDD